jgi:transcriptional antiterminator Rof (Rho-off)
MARPTESRSLFCQMAGRVTRLLGATWEESERNGKLDCLLLDFVGNAGRHRLVTALDLLDGSVDGAVRRRAVKRSQEEEIDVIEALETAEREEVVQQRLDLVASVRYRVVEVEDQFALLGVRPRPGRWGGAAITTGQLEVLKRAKIKGADKLDRGQASAVIDALVARRRQGLCTLPMASRLLRAGVNPDLTFERAHAVIDAIAANGWRGVPASLLESEPDLLLSPESMAAKRKALGV